MTRMAYEDLRSHAASLNREGRCLLKESEIERLSYNSVDPLSVMIHLDSLRLLWY
jgi:hypothetical protein